MTYDLTDIPTPNTPEAIEVFKACTANVHGMIADLEEKKQEASELCTIDSDARTHNKYLGKTRGIETALHNLYLLRGYMEAGLREVCS